MGVTSPLDGMLVYREVSLQRDMLPGQFSCITVARNALWKLVVFLRQIQTRVARGRFQHTNQLSHCVILPRFFMSMSVRKIRRTNKRKANERSIDRSNDHMDERTDERTNDRSTERMDGRMNG